MKINIRIKIFLFVFFACVFFVNTSQAGLVDIETLFLQGNYKEIDRMFERTAGQYQEPNAKVAQLYYGAVANIWLKNYSRALDVLGKVPLTDINDDLKDKVNLAIFDALFLSEQYDNALEQINKTLELNPKSQFLSLMYLKAAKVNLKLANWDAAHRYLQMIVDGLPRSMEYFVAKQLLEEERYFTVQVGSFIERDKALDLLEDLKRKGEYAYIIETKTEQGEVFYRVRVGRLSNLKEAKTLKTKLSNQGFPTRIFP